jgi:hypothetical protein
MGLTFSFDARTGRLEIASKKAESVAHFAMFAVISPAPSKEVGSIEFCLGHLLASSSTADHFHSFHQAKELK